MEQQLLTLPEHMSLPPVLSRVRVALSFVFCAVFCRSLFSFVIWPLCCLSIFDLRIQITPLVSSKKDLYSKKDMNLGRFNIDCM